MNKKPAKSYKKMHCKICDALVRKVDIKSKGVTCSKCVQEMLNKSFALLK
jgi:hypothetical protein